jgi:cytochrome bd ubiquinol oxidase subunit II
VTLQTIWFILIFVLLAGYAVLDGMDLGLGILHLAARGDRARRQALAAVGPVWDGNEVWLLTAGGALFAAFPAVYATVFSGFYLALVLLLVALIGRAVSVEFRSRVASPHWRSLWDVVFSLGSIVAAILLGVALGNILEGVPINPAGEFAGTFLGLLNPLAILVGLMSLVTFTMHGAIALAHKTDSPGADRFGRLAYRLALVAVVLFLVTGAALGGEVPYLWDAVTQPLPVVLECVVLAGLASVLWLTAFRRFSAAQVASSVAIASMIALAGAVLFPRLVPSSIDLAYSLTAENASSTQGTLWAMLIIALVGMPLVIAYTAWTHWLFRGKAKVEEEGY